MYLLPTLILSPLVSTHVFYSQRPGTRSLIGIRLKGTQQSTDVQPSPGPQHLLSVNSQNLFNLQSAISRHHHWLWASFIWLLSKFQCIYSALFQFILSCFLNLSCLFQTLSTLSIFMHSFQFFSAPFWLPEFLSHFSAYYHFYSLFFILFYYFSHGITESTVFYSALLSLHIYFFSHFSRFLNLNSWLQPTWFPESAFQVHIFCPLCHSVVPSACLSTAFCPQLYQALYVYSL
jgi:hypothetical protein